MAELQREVRLTYLFIAHDLSIVRHISGRVAVMYLGKVVEVSPAVELYEKPIHPYTVSLLSAVPLPDPEKNKAREPLVLEGDADISRGDVIAGIERAPLVTDRLRARIVWMGQEAFAPGKRYLVKAGTCAATAT